MSIFLVFFLFVRRCIFNIAEESEEAGEHFLVEEIIEFNLFLCLIIIKKHFEEFKHLDLNTLFERVKQMRSESLYEGIPLRSLVFTQNKASQ